MVMNLGKTMRKALAWLLSFIMAIVLIPEIGGGTAVYAADPTFMLEDSETVYTSTSSLVAAINALNPKPDEIDVIMPCSDYEQLQTAFTWAYNSQTTSIKNIQGTKMIIRLTGDIQMPNSANVLAADYSTGFETVTLDLNGHGITGNGNVRLIRVLKGTLILTDSAPETGIHYYYIDGAGLAHLVDSTSDEAYIDAGVENQGNFTGGYLTKGALVSKTESDYGNYGGSAVVVDCNGTDHASAHFIMRGGTLIGNKATVTDSLYCGGVITAQYEDSSVEFTGGAIIGNITGNGGALHLRYNSSGVMSGTALIERNTCNTSYAAGVFVDDSAFTMTGGAIRNNTNIYTNSYGAMFVTDNTYTDVKPVVVIGGTASITGNRCTQNYSRVGGVGVYSTVDFTLEGTPTISGNTYVTQVGNDYVPVDGNMVLVADYNNTPAKIKIGDDFNPVGKIGVRCTDYYFKNPTNYPIDITTGVTADNHDAVKAAFKSDLAGYAVKSSTVNANQLAIGVYATLSSNPDLTSGNVTPRIGTAITASSTADDLTWKWQRSTTKTGEYEDISGATGSSYTPVLDDLGYFIRAVATQGDVEKYSDPTDAAVIKKAAPAAPASTAAAEFEVDYAFETFEVGEGYEVVTSDSPDAEAITAFPDGFFDQDSPKVYIRVPGTEDTLPGNALQVNLGKRPATPSGFTTTNATNGAADDGQINGTTAAMEFSLSGSDQWSVATAPSTLVHAGVYLVRIKATDSAPHSYTAEVTVESNYTALDATETPLTISLPGGHTVPEVGDVLTATTIASDLTYEWFVNGVSQGAASETAQTYTVQPEDYGKIITVRVKQIKKADASDYAAGSEPTLTSAETSPVDANVVVGNIGYATLQDAADAADGKTATLLKDITENVSTTGTVTIDLNGKTVTGNVTAASGELTIEDSQSGGGVTGTVSADTGNVVIEAGRYTTAPAENAPGTVTLQGGTFAVDPTTGGAAPASGKMLISLDGGEYCIGDRPDTVAASVNVSAGETAADVSSEVAPADQAAAQSVAESVAATSGLTDLAVSKVAEIVQDSNTVTDPSKNIVIVPALEVTTEAYEVDGNNASITLNIEATYRSYETDGSITDAADVQNNINDQDKVKEIGSGTLDTEGTDVEVQVTVPDEFAGALGAQASNTEADPVHVFMKHIHKNKHYEYPATLFCNGPATPFLITFVNPNGFSPFTLTQTSESVAEIGGLYYTDFQDAIDDAEDGAVINLVNDADVNAELKTAKTITIVKSSPTDTNTITVTGGEGIKVTVTDNGDGSYTFTGTVIENNNGGGAAGNTGGRTSSGLPAVEPVPTENPVTTEPQPDSVSYKDCTKNSDCPMSAFRDLKTTAWYHDGIHWALDEDVMNGFEDGTFKPDGNTTRGQIATMLYRMEGSPAIAAGNSYSDVKAGKWYTIAIGWATANNIVTGFGDGTFKPDAPVTREQLAAMLYRYADYKGKVVVEGPTAALNFSDADSVSKYAKEPVSWMVKKGLLKGTDGKLMPRGKATRAQVATLFMRYSEL